MKEAVKYMGRALRLAEKGAGWVNPNPLVGAVIARDGHVIGEGCHEYFGGPHAEAAAIANCMEDAAGATMYVTMEPCSHTGKTPPCAQLLLEKKIGRVVVGMADPNPLVNGRGIAMLISGGITVETGVMEEQIRLQNEVFIKYITTGEPFVVLKTAMTLDGKTATVANASRWISGEESRRLVHRMRQRYSAVLVGVDTVVHDDPLLNVRLRSKNVRQPLKVIVDSSLRMPMQSRVLTNDPQLTLVAATAMASKERVREIKRAGAQVLICPSKGGQVELAFLMKALGAMEIDSVLVEGGSNVAFSALETGIVDKVVTFVAPKILGGKGAPTPVGGKGIERIEEAIGLADLKVRRIGNDLLLEGRIKK
jgi:diaminohydroxyphosphoribosylaminopyrimidine deaminase/5-amino-6-(5-phosphoribosylamino)uracil reductase